MKCNHTRTDLTQGLGKERHYYCRKCKSHWYKGRFWTKQQWDDWINEDFLNLMSAKEVTK
jgi:hypothetical protein